MYCRWPFSILVFMKDEPISPRRVQFGAYLGAPSILLYTPFSITCNFLISLSVRGITFGGITIIYITPDLTPAEREAARKLREELTVRRAAGETNLVIWKGRIVTASSSNRPGVDSTARRAASHPTPAGATTQTDTSDASAVVTQTQTGPQETSSLVPTAITREQRQESQA